MTINLCTNCQHNYQGIDCIKDRVVFPNAQACVEAKSKTNMAIVLPIKNVTNLVTQPEVKQTTWRIMAKDDPTKCNFNAYLP